MLFSGIPFLLYFLPLFLWVYCLVPKSARNITALLFSVLFYAWGAPKFVFILLASTIIDFYIVRWMDKQQDHSKRRWLLTLSILLNVGLLVYFKYANFFVENFDILLGNLGFSNITWTKIALPIGISFYTFQTLSYSIDIYRKITKPLEKLTDYLLYIMLFPQMIAGPIVRFTSIAHEIKDRVVSAQNLHQGLFRFSVGLSKKVLLANPIGEIGYRYLSMDVFDLSAPQAWMGILAYTFQIYFDFSGYSDMAIGLGRMMGFTFPENFNHPYISKSITEFWRRWHITLGSWMRDYLYVPLGGNRKGKWIVYRNLWIVFLISGLWHGASWNFLIWGAIHGTFLILDRIFLGKVLAKLPPVVSTLFTFFIVVLSWVVFKIEDLTIAMDYYEILFTGEWHGNILIFNRYTYFFFALCALFSFWNTAKFGRKLSMRFYALNESRFSFNLKITFSILLLTLNLIWLSDADFNPFIYFRF